MARRKSVIWISAPAGAGKTCAVVTYLASRGLPSLWYNVDSRDRDAANLFHYLTMAAQLAKPRRKLVLPAFTAENQHGVAAFAKGFFEKLYEQLPSPSAVVLDDYQDARSEPFDEVVREAIAALPKGVIVIIAQSRAASTALAQARRLPGGSRSSAWTSCASRRKTWPGSSACAGQTCAVRR